MSEPPNVHLALASRADNVALVREVLAGLGETVEFGPALDDAKAAVSEACNNVVLHAYGGEEGPMEVEMRLHPGELEVVVRDYGVGIARHKDGDESPARGIGLSVIEALTIRSQLRANAGHGVEMVMGFEIPGQPLASHREDPRPARTPLERVGADSDVEIAITPAALCGAILNRLVSALAARAGFSIDRLSDAQLVTDALAARLESVLDGASVSARIDVLERTVALRLAPLRAGGSAVLLAASAIGELGPVIERLTDEVDVSDSEGGETIRLLMRDARTMRSTAA
jgi:anti-sigma regulatory factor (Ser/Thr protein kinase)